MARLSIDELNGRFGRDGAIQFSAGQGGLPMVRLATTDAEANVYLYGAHVTHFQPRGQKPVLFLSPRSSFVEGKAIRGGIPICWPWFANKHDEPDAPFHGFARTSFWEVESAQAGMIVLRLDSSDATRKIWPFDFTARYTVRISKALDVTLEITNGSSSNIDYTEALHSYFAVSDVRTVALAGLTHSKFFDKTDNTEKTDERDPLRFEGETNSIYFGSTSTCVIDDRGLSRRIVVDKRGSDATVVWNPWTETATKMADIGPENWPGMLCVETANTIHRPVVLRPGESHATAATIRIE